MCSHSTIKWNHLSNSNQSMKLNLFFATPIMQDIIESNLTDYVLNMAAFSKGLKLSNRGGFQSDHFFKPEKEFESLWYSIEERLNHYHNEMKLKGRVAINEWWFNVNYKGCMNRLHQHPNSIHSGVYYIKAPENCGSIVFPHPSSTLMWGWQGGMLKEPTSTNSSMVSLKPVKNLLYIFPSWADHSVDANESNEERISLSFNTTLK